MRTKLTLDQDVLEAVQNLAFEQGKTLGQVVSELVRKALELDNVEEAESLDAAIDSAESEGLRIPEEEEEAPGPLRGKVVYDDLLGGFDFARMGAPFEHFAYLSLDTGEVFLKGSEDSGFEDDEDLPEDLEQSDRYVAIPHAHDLDLGRSLNLRFIAEKAPKLYEKVAAMFGRKGAYRRFKDFVIDQNLDKAWYTFRDQETKKALLEWCAMERIEVDLTPKYGPEAGGSAG